MVGSAPADLLLGLVHVGPNCRHDCIDLHLPPAETVLIGWIGNEDEIRLVVLLILMSALTGRVAVVVVDLVDICLPRWALRLNSVVNPRWQLSGR